MSAANNSIFYGILGAEFPNHALLQLSGFPHALAMALPSPLKCDSDAR